MDTVLKILLIVYLIIAIVLLLMLVNFCIWIHRKFRHATYLLKEAVSIRSLLKHRRHQEYDKYIGIRIKRTRK